MVILSIALLGHAASALSEHHMAQTSQYRSEALHVARQFVERLRADEDFAGLLSRIRTRQLGTGVFQLDNGRSAYTPSEYCTGFVLPDWLDSMVVRVEAPLDASSPFALKENLDAPFFGLPGDLNGDSTIDGDSRDLDYLALPLSIEFSWTPPGHPTSKLRLATWMRGYR